MQRPYNLMLDPEKYHRRSIRLAGYDYSAEGAYYVTLCAKDKKSVFGKVRDGVMVANVYGTIAKDCWVAMSTHFSYVTLDEFVLMPNHFHAILVIDNAESSLGTLVQSFKSAVTRQTNIYRQSRGLAPVRVWQRNYYETIIRNERHLDNIRRYIAENPARWHLDNENPDRM